MKDSALWIQDDEDDEKARKSVEIAQQRLCQARKSRTSTVEPLSEHPRNSWRFRVFVVLTLFIVLCILLIGVGYR